MELDIYAPVLPNFKDNLLSVPEVVVQKGPSLFTTDAALLMLHINFLHSF